ncbi:MAG: DNA translocase FtsK 4TM domain-containing protein [Candidatus Dojkabacteria bacterium]|jgi:S-DNA-T family DNA segregation ATPase FtsK/SpoIIIE|nr:DNA translocase FtsK 4TM domain-containing protein [Candidatus Dojkabacteria bacterium]
MSRKKKKKKIDIKSSETKIFFGLILFVLGIALLIAPFVGEQAVIFVHISKFLGWPSLVWGAAVTYLSINLLTQGKSCKNFSQLGGLFTLAISLNTLFTFWLPQESLENVEGLQRAGGTLGKVLHLAINNTFGEIIELVILLILLVVAFSFVTGVKLEEITSFLQQMFSNIKLGDIKEKFTKESNGEKLIISGIEDENQLTMDEENKEPTITDSNVDKFNQSFVRAETGQLQKDSPATQSGSQEENSEPTYPNWVYPKIDNLQEPQKTVQDQESYKKDARVIERVLKNFEIPAKAIEIAVGPTVVRYALALAADIRVNKIKSLVDNLAVSLMINKELVRIETPIPGTSYVGIEIPNKTPNFVYAKEMAKKLLAEADKYELPMILGKDIAGLHVIKDLVNIPHLLVAGATNTGKSVGINSILAGLLLTKTPDELKLIMVDPKRVEMTPYNGIPHLLTPIITDMELVVNALNWSIEEMQKRYRLLEQLRVRKITEYNQKMGFVAMPYLIIVVDEMADLMLVAGKEVEPKVQRLAQMGRAVGIHLILATQKPIVEVITGLIKSNIPGRIAFAVTSSMDSRVILDQTGAENLLGRGDMLFKDQTMPKSIRIQGTFISTEDTEDIITQVKAQISDESSGYSQDLKSAIEKEAPTPGSSSGEREPEFPLALKIVIAEGKASASLLQRRLKVGYNKAARLIEQLEESGAIAAQDGAKPRDVLVTSASEILGDSSPTQEY